MKVRHGCSALLLTVALVACGKAPPAPDEVRPVRTVVAGATPAGVVNTYAGEVRPRYESLLGFRVTGKILRREVNVGDMVKAGQVLARLDDKDLALAQASSQAQVAARQAQAEIAHVNFERDKKLLDAGAVSQQAYDNDEAAYKAAQAQLDADQALLRQSANQTGYAELRADHDGVITAIEAEAGQVVAAGQTVARLAWSGEKEIATSIPEDQIGRVRPGLAVQVALWTGQAGSVPGTVREVAGSADAATRTYAVRVSMPNPPPQMQLGMTATVRVPMNDAPQLIHLPLAAAVEQDGKQGVWVYEAAGGSVQFRPVVIAGVEDNEMLVASGLAGGEVVVTAGAPLLRQGQKVKLLSQPAVAAR
jgi:RND family efflux transporter MFP subunit